MALNVDQIDASELLALAGRLANLPGGVGGGAGGRANIYTSAAQPTFPAPKGSLCIDTVTPKLWQCSVATGTWVSVGGET